MVAIDGMRDCLVPCVFRSKYGGRSMAFAAAVQQQRQSRVNIVTLCDRLQKQISVRVVASVFRDQTGTVTHEISASIAFS